MSSRSIRRSGTFLPMTAICVVALFSFVALAIDLGMLTVARTECQNAADSAALAGARLLNNSTGVADNNREAAEAAARAVVEGNDLFAASFLPGDVQTAAARVYNYDTSTQTFAIGSSKGTDQSWSAMEVTIGITQPTYFAKVMGINSLNNGATAIAVHRPRDIAIVLDFSGSMGDGSILNHPDSTNGTIESLRNPDPNYPQFGHYSIYALGQTDNGSGTGPASYTSSNPTSRQNPLRATFYSGTTGLANHTMETTGGPPMIEDFLTAPNDPATVSGSTAFNNAFRMWDPAGGGSYNAATAGTPAPASFATQSGSYVGDKSPRADGGRGPRTSNLGTTTQDPTYSNYGSWTNDNNWTSMTVNGQTWQWRRQYRNFTESTVSDTTSAWVNQTDTTNQGQREYQIIYRQGTSGGADTPTQTVINTTPSSAFKDTHDQGSASTSTTYAPASATSVMQYAGRSLTGTSGRDLTQITLPTKTGAGLPVAYANSLPTDGSTADQLLPTNAQRTQNQRDGGDTWAKFLDILWERYGYDLDMENFRSQTGTTKTAALVPSADRFQGYSMGPGYYGKTFFVWPPDPRYGVDSDNNGIIDTSTNSSELPDVTSPDPNNPAFDTSGKPMCDWRRRFFLRGDGSHFNPNTDNINRILFRNSTGHVMNDVVSSVTSGFTASNCPGYYRINYSAIMAWLKTGAKVLPTNLRAGRILYYSSMPTDLTGSGQNTLDQRWWREYIHYILGVNTWDPTNLPLSQEPGNASRSWARYYDSGGSWWVYDPTKMLAGVESRNAINGPVSVDSNMTTTFTPANPNTTGEVPNPRPYMNYSDNINRPRLHFWFGPLTTLYFMEWKEEKHPWWAGTVREAQCWQLKASINSVLDDIRINHPNDFVGMAFFAVRSHFNTPLAPMSQDWYTLKNVLFFRKDTVASMKANLGQDGVSSSTLEHRPYNQHFLSQQSNGTVNALNGIETTQIPNSSGSTDPAAGLAVAFNLLSSSTQLDAANYGTRGRRGAAKIVIFETDGQPNTSPSWQLTGTGPSTRYVTGGTLPTSSRTLPSLSGGDQSAGQRAITVVEAITAGQPASASTTWGHSTGNTPARVYGIGFGDLLEGYTGSNYSSLSSNNAKGALELLMRVQQAGNTSPPGDSPDTTLPFDHVITGPYANRISKMRVTLERIMQSGVQVTLIE